MSTGTYTPPTFANIARQLLVAFTGDNRKLSVRHTHVANNPFLSFWDLPVAAEPTTTSELRQRLANRQATRAPDWQRIMGRTSHPFLHPTLFASPTIAAYACPFLSIGRSSNREFINPTAFSSFLRSGRPVVIQLEHNPAFVVASTEDGSLALSVDEYGLRCEFNLSTHNQALGEIVVHAMANDQHLWRHMSIGLILDDCESVMHTTEDGEQIREWTTLAIDEISLTSKPAYRQTAVSLLADRIPDLFQLDWNLRCRVLAITGQ